MQYAVVLSVSFLEIFGTDSLFFSLIELSLFYFSISPIAPSNASFRFVSFHFISFRVFFLVFTAHIIGLCMLLLFFLSSFLPVVFLFLFIFFLFFKSNVNSFVT